MTDKPTVRLSPLATTWMQLCLSQLSWQPSLMSLFDVGPLRTRVLLPPQGDSTKAWRTYSICCSQLLFVFSTVCLETLTNPIKLKSTLNISISFHLFVFVCVLICLSLARVLDVEWLLGYDSPIPHLPPNGMGWMSNVWDTTEASEIRSSVFETEIKNMSAFCRKRSLSARIAALPNHTLNQ